MWWTAALQAYQAKQGGGGGAAGMLDSESSSGGNSVGVSFDSSNWTVATGGSSAAGQRPQGSGNDTALYIGAGLVGLLILTLAIRKG